MHGEFCVLSYHGEPRQNVTTWPDYQTYRTYRNPINPSREEYKAILTRVYSSFLLFRVRIRV
nr:MAG TPA: hypothetical protein [Caudoviricetes sp.]